MDHDVYDVYNGMAATQLHDAAWQKSRRSNSQGSCVEFARLPDGAVAVRNSRFPTVPRSSTRAPRSRPCCWASRTASSTT